MQSFRLKVLSGVLIASAMLVLPAKGEVRAPESLTLTVEDGSGAAVQGATVKHASGSELGRTDASGRLTFNCETPCQLHVDAEGFKGKFIEISASATVQLEPASASQVVTVTAYREPLGELVSPVTTRSLQRVDLQTAAPISM